MWSRPFTVENGYLVYCRQADDRLPASSGPLNAISVVGISSCLSFHLHSLTP